ncbi:hypothetical protein FRB91_000397 [Serendipita sp. 411]|nr:hypothetical protein FRB91_000397 [Serendipita sp. 411]
MSDLNEVISLARTLVKENQFNNEALRIFLASISPGLRGTDAFIDRNVSKWSLRMNRQWDMGVSMAQKEDQEKGATDSDDNIEMSLFPGNTQTKLEVPLRWNGRVGRWIPIKSDERNVEDEGDEEYAELTGDSVREPLRLPTRRTAIGRYMQASMLNASKFNHAALCEHISKTLLRFFVYLFLDNLSSFQITCSRPTRSCQRTPYYVSGLP